MPYILLTILKSVVLIGKHLCAWVGWEKDHILLPWADGIGINGWYVNRQVII